MRNPFEAAVLCFGGPEGDAGSVIDIAAGEIAVALDSAITQEGPVGAGKIDPLLVDRHDQDFLAGARLRENLAVRCRDEAAAPELDALVGPRLVAHAIHRGDVDTVGDRMTALDGLPAGLLPRAVLGLLRHQPA